MSIGYGREPEEERYDPEKRAVIGALHRQADNQDLAWRIVGSVLGEVPERPDNPTAEEVQRRQRSRFVSHIAQNLSFCKHCDEPIFWISSRDGKRLAVDVEKGRGLTLAVVGSPSQVEAWPEIPGQWSCHFDTCKARHG